MHRKMHHVLPISIPSSGSAAVHLSNSEPSRAMIGRTSLTIGLILGLVLIAGVAHSGESDCGSLKNAYGPFDYTNADHRANRIPIVTEGHFTAPVASLQHGVSSDRPGADIDYTLRAVPNYHEALYAMAMYELQTGKSPPEGSRYTADCWFDRAIRFSPSDGVVRLIYGIYLHKKAAAAAAEQEYLKAIELMPDSAETHYNLGLLYFDQANYEKAREEAKQAYEKGHPLRGLRQKLEQQGEWTD